MSSKRWPVLLLALAASACVSITPRVGSATPGASPAPAASVGPSSTEPPPATPTISAATPDVPPPTDQPSVPPTDEPAAQPTDEPAPAPPDTAQGAGSRACSDKAFKLAGYSWQVPYEWRFNADSTPRGYDPGDVLDVIKVSMANITGARNDCGLPDNVSAQAVYLGQTRADACGDEGDGINTIGFGQIPRLLPRDSIAVTCPYTFTRGGDIAEADIIINEDIDWALSIDECSGLQEVLEATVTHELGHVFGLGHVSERRHGELTMSPRSNGPCDDAEATLGLGDILGLETLYGSR